MSSCPLTPPLSPTKQTRPASLRSDDLGFSCQGHSAKGGYMNHGHLYRLLNGGSVYSEKLLESPCIELFGSVQVTAALAGNLPELFALLKREWFTAAKQSQGFQSGMAVTQRRFTKFQSYLKASVIRYLQFWRESLVGSVPVRRDPKELYRKLLRELHLLFLQLGSPAELGSLLSHSLPGCRNPVVSPEYHQFHLYLDLMWTLTELAHLLPSDGHHLHLLWLPGSHSLFSETVHFVLYALLHWAYRIFQCLDPMEYHEVSPFHCGCIRELWLMVLQTCDHRRNHHSEVGFMDYLQSICQLLLQPPEDLPSLEESFVPKFPSTLQSDGPVYCLWLHTHLLPLYTCDRLGATSTSCQVPTNLTSTQKLLNLFLNHESKEETLRACLLLCQRLSGHLSSGLGLLGPLMDYFLKRLNSDFHSFDSSRNMGAKTGGQWVDQLVACCDQQSRVAESSLQLFLRMLHCQLSSSPHTLWKQLRGRVYTKLSPRRCRDLTDTGIYNCFSILLVLVISTEFETELVDKVSELVPHLPPTSSLATLVLFALVSLLQRRELDFSAPLSAILDSFESQVHTYRGDPAEFAHLPVYLRGIQDVVETSADLAAGEHRLLGSGFVSLLQHCSGSELSSALSTLDSFFSKLRSILEGNSHTATQHHQEMIKGLLERLHTPLFSLGATGQPYPQSAAKLAAELWLLLLCLKQLNFQDKLTELFDYFGTSSTINSQVQVAFLSQLLDNSQATSWILDRPGGKEALLRAWLRLGLLITPQCHNMDLLTRRMFLALPDDWLQPLREVKDNHAIKMAEFFLLLPQGCTSHSAVQPYLRDFVAALKGLPFSLLAHGYRLAGHLVESCATLLYAKFVPECLLLKILDELVLPRSIYSGERPTAPVALSSALPQFIAGLLRLPIQTDPCLQRKLRDIVVLYLPKYMPKVVNSSSLWEHPLMRTVRKCPNFAEVFLNVLRDHFLTKRGSSLPTHFSQAMALVTEWTKVSDSTQLIKIAEAVLPAVFELQITAENSPGVGELTQLVVGKVRQKLESKLQCPVLLPSLESLVSGHLAWHSARVLRILEALAELHRPVVTALLPHLLRTVEELEFRRGSGRDTLLRNGLRTIQTKLGQSVAE